MTPSTNGGCVARLAGSGEIRAYMRIFRFRMFNLLHVVQDVEFHILCGAPFNRRMLVVSCSGVHFNLMSLRCS